MTKRKVSQKARSAAGKALGALGNAAGGKARAESLTAARRSEIASQGAKKRWQLHRLRQKIEAALLAAQDPQNDTQDTQESA